jgi:hypothetical protein
MDILVEDGRIALLIECKWRGAREPERSAVETTLFRFLDLAEKYPHLKWVLAFVAQREIPPKSRRPTILRFLHPPSNLLRESLTASTHFVFFDPPRDPAAPAPYFVTDSGNLGLGLAGIEHIVDTEEMWERLRDGTLPLSAQVEAGMALGFHNPEILRAEEAALRGLVHGLMHLGRLREALYVRRMFGGDGDSSDREVVESLMLDFHFTRWREPRRERAGAKAIGQMMRLLGRTSLQAELAIRTFAGPIRARWGCGDGWSMLDGVENRVRRLETEDAPYYELLGAVRTAQLVAPAGEREELLVQAEHLLTGLPANNRLMGSALISAARADAGALHGIETRFNVEAGNTDPPPAHPD